MTRPGTPIEPVHTIGRIAKALTRLGDARLRPLGFATAQLPVLAALRDGARLPQAELTRLANVEQSSMAQLLARMERDGLVRRDPDPADRRSSLVALTEAARARVGAGRTVLQQSNADAVAGLSADEVAQLVGLLRRVLANVETSAARAAVAQRDGEAGDAR